MEKFIAWAYANKVIVGIVLLVLAYGIFGGGFSGEFAGYPVGDK